MNHLVELSLLPPTTERVTCCFKFALQDDIITLIRRVDENWAEGKLGDKVGIFPVLFSEVG